MRDPSCESKRHFTGQGAESSTSFTSPPFDSQKWSKNRTCSLIVGSKLFVKSELLDIILFVNALLAGLSLIKIFNFFQKTWQVHQVLLEIDSGVIYPKNVV